jgi:deoxyribonucleoside regulator
MRVDSSLVHSSFADGTAPTRGSEIRDQGGLLDTPAEDSVMDLLRIAHLFHVEELSKVEIGQRMGISRFKVTRSLRRARELGLVRVELASPLANMVRLETELAGTFGLQQAVVSPAPQDTDPNVLREKIGSVAAEYLYKQVRHGEVVGVTWGRTLSRAVLDMRTDPQRRVTVVELMGGSGYLPKDFDTLGVAPRLAEKLGGRCFYLPVPAIVETAQMRDAFLQDKTVRQTIDMFQQITTAAMGVGVVGEDLAPYQAGLLSAQDLVRLAAQGAVCNVGGRFYAQDGQMVVGVFDERINAIEHAQLSKVPRRIVVAGGPHKIQALLATIHAGLCTVLITDEATAAALIAGGR